MNEPSSSAVLVPATKNEIIRMGMDTVQGFEAIQRCAKLLSASPLVPDVYRGDKGIASCVIAMNLANRIGADILLVMQNLYVVQGRPGWSSKFLIATFNQCGKYTAIRYEFIGTEGKDDWGCRAWAMEKATGDKLVGPTVTIKVAKDEKWYEKTGSKWKTMPEQMLRYRAAAWFINTVAPELAMGLPTAEENADVFDAEIVDGDTGEVKRVRTKAKDVTPKASEPGLPNPVGEWTHEDLEELETLLDLAYSAFSDAGFKDQGTDFVEKNKSASRSANPVEFLAKLRSDVEALTRGGEEKTEAADDKTEAGRLL